MRGQPGHEIKPYEGQVTHRKRRGKLVEIPTKWRGHVTHFQAIKKRNEIKRRTRKENK